MAFYTPFDIETDEQEQARLAGSAFGSINRELSELPVLNSHPGRGQVLELTRNFFGARIIVTPIEFRPGQTTGAKWFNTAPEQRPVQEHDGAWSCLVLASTHELYPVGRFDIVASVSELRRARPVDLLQVSI